jgi:hypothetical protein
MGTPVQSLPGTPLSEEMINDELKKINDELYNINNEINIFENEINRIDNIAEKNILNKLIDERYAKKISLIEKKSKLTGNEEKQNKERLDNLMFHLNSKLSEIDYENALKELQEVQEAERKLQKHDGGKRRRTNKRRTSKRRTNKRRPSKRRLSKRLRTRK